MAFTATLEFDVRTTGSDANGGGFDPTTAGTDYSQQDSAQVAYTDLVIDATTNTKCTSAAHPFTSAHVGNLVNVTGGTGFTVQRVQVISVASGVATMDKSLGTLSSIGGTGNLGGGLLTLAKAASLAINDNTIHVKSGTYTVTTAVNPTTRSVWWGYNSTHRDGGTKPLITTSTNSTRLFSLSSTVGFINISFSNTASTRFTGIASAMGVGGGSVFVIDCVFDGHTYAVDGGNGSGDAGSQVFSHMFLSGVEVKNCTVGGVFNFFETYVTSCYMHGNTGTAITLRGNGANSFLYVYGSIIVSNTKGIASIFGSDNVRVIQSTIANNTGDGINFTAAGTSDLNLFTIENSIIYGNGGWGINLNAKPIAINAAISRNNAFGSNSSGDRNNLASGYNEVSLSANPFTNSGSGDYSLNTTAGGGAACKAAGFPGTFPGGTSVSRLDIGAVQTDPVSAGSGSFGWIG
jgi:hypothetical protein